MRVEGKTTSQSVAAVCSHHFDQLRYGDLKLHCDRIRHIFHRSDELIVPPEQPPEQTVL